ncbi:MAG: NADPH:quinone oxidoreductase family protein [Rhodobacter sp.]|nr:NADPH:quinone oxidoreductase family protein [Rhodobacter sp.]MCA3456421.1 NADPH:quinone oxidoreductase family protein [Rhodobacter sp.]MCA3461415.1 NADPH:quinone oxidoreductase family protein [Rhodobacter sp.]MCA3464762.1 NADPH:quinone oxidoreductase family protein [Rhodobacter sp.]MCA3467735.1 NADPH:quinone oxidoreductase family protein [Rhodobacter sp.]
MRALQISTFGLPPDLRTVPVPDPGPGEVLLRTAACGLNFADLLMSGGSYQDTPPLPFTLGMEVAGTVEACGPAVTGFVPGARVAAVPGSGGLADFVAVPAARCVAIPDGMSFVQAASFQIAYGTSHLALDHRARLQPGETLLVLGAAGGVGLTAVEIGKHMGARVIASARGQARLAVAQRAGADVLIDSDTADLRDRLRAEGGVDVVFDTVGGPAFLQALRATRPEGRLLCVGFAGGDVPQIPANLLLVKNLSVIGLYWGGYLAFRPEVLTASMSRLFGWFGDGILRPHISHVLPLDRAAKGLDLLRGRKATGKVVVTLP